MEILKVLITTMAIIAAAGMLVASYMAVVIVKERKAPLLCMDNEPCRHRINESCSIKEQVLHFNMEVVANEKVENIGSDVFVKFHCDKREAE